MDQEQIEKALETLQCYHELISITNELYNRIPKKHHDIIFDLMIEIEDIANQLMDLEHSLYYDYLN